MGPEKYVNLSFDISGPEKSWINTYVLKKSWTFRIWSWKSCVWWVVKPYSIQFSAEKASRWWSNFV